MAEKRQTLAEALELRHLWHDAEVRNAESTYNSRKQMAKMALEDMARQVEEDRLYGTEARNINGYMVDLETARRDLEEAQGKLDLVLSLIKTLEEGGE